MFRETPRRLGVVAGRLNECPATPNCVCSQNTETSHRIAPLAYTGDWEAARERLVAALSRLPRTRIVTQEGTYLHAECTSLIWRFVDDVEFLIDPAAQVIHVRSASRVGRSDLGVNRARVEQIRRLFAG